MVSPTFTSVSPCVCLSHFMVLSRLWFQVPDQTAATGCPGEVGIPILLLKYFFEYGAQPGIDEYRLPSGVIFVFYSNASFFCNIRPLNIKTYLECVVTFKAKYGTQSLFDPHPLLHLIKIQECELKYIATFI